MNEASGRVMGIDYGSVRIGIAISDESRTIAFGRETIANDKDALKKISDIVKDNNVKEIIIGYPLNLKGEAGSSAKSVDDFKDKLENFFNNTPFNHLTVSLLDERFTSKMAMDSMIQSGMKKKKRQDKSELDVISAAILLQSYLDKSKKNL